MPVEDDIKLLQQLHVCHIEKYTPVSRYPQKDLFKIADTFEIGWFPLGVRTLCFVAINQQRAQKQRAYFSSGQQLISHSGGRLWLWVKYSNRHECFRGYQYLIQVKGSSNSEETMDGPQIERRCHQPNNLCTLHDFLNTRNKQWHHIKAKWDSVPWAGTQQLHFRT